MSNVREKLTECFRLVFPNLPESSIANASSTNVAEWDSLAMITLVQVIQEEFDVDIDLERLSDLDSYEALANYLTAMTR